jgi:uncharacterized protein YacL
VEPAGKRGPAWWQDIQVIGGLTAVFLGLFVVLFIAALSIALIRDDADKVATIASAAFTVIGTLVGAYFGIKVGTDQTKTAMEQTQRAMEQVERVTLTMREEAAKAQALAAHVSTGSTAEQALSAAEAFAFRASQEASSTQASSQ